MEDLIEMAHWRVSIARALSLRGRSSESVAQLEKLIAHDTASLYNAHPIVVEARQLNVQVLRRLGRYDEASKELSTLAQMPTLQATPRELSNLHLSHGQLLSHFQWKHLNAESELRRAYEMKCQLLGADSADAAEALTNLAHAVRRQHRVVEAERMYKESIEIMTTQKVVAPSACADRLIRSLCDGRVTTT